MTTNITIGEPQTPPQASFAATTDGFVYLCIGGTHTLTPIGLADSPWVGQGVSLNASLGEALPISTIPELGQLQSFTPGGCSWEIKLPNDAAPIESSFQLHSEHTAQIYIIPVRLGHYRLEFGDLDKPISAPVIGDEVVASVQVVSYYTKQGLQGVDVKWFVDGAHARNVTTTDSGRGEFKHTFIEAGPHTLKADVYSAYNDEWTTHTFSLNVYEHNPWEEATLTVNGESLSWLSPVVLVHGQPNEVIVEVSSDIAAQLNFALVDGNGPVIDVTPPDGDWQDPVNGQFKWMLTPEQGKSGRITLVFYSREVALSWDHPTWVVSRDFSDDVDVVIDSDPVAIDGNFFVRNIPRTIKLVPKVGSPIQGLPVTLARVIKSGLEEDDLESLPVFDLPTSALSWDITGKTNSGTFELIFSHAGVTPPLKLALNILLSDNLNDEAVVRIGGVDFPVEGQAFFRGEGQTLTLVAKPGSPLGRLSVMLQWITGTGLEAANFVCEPDLDAYTSDHSWSITGPADKSGKFQLRLVGRGMNMPIVLPESIVLSTILEDEAQVNIDNVPVSPDGEMFFWDVPRVITVSPKLGSPLGSHPLTLACTVMGDLDPANVKSEPDFGKEQRVHQWAVTGSEKSGTFQLNLSGKGMAQPISMINTLFDLASHLDLKVDGTGHWFFRDRPRKVTLAIKEGSPLIGREVSLICSVISGLDPDNIKSKPDFGSPQQTSQRWEVTGSSKSGVFQFGLMFQGYPAPILMSTHTLLSTNLNDEGEAYLDGFPLPAGDVVFEISRPREVSIKIKAGSPLKGYPLRMGWIGGHMSEFSSDPNFYSLTLDHEWIVAAKKAGSFEWRVSGSTEDNMTMTTPIQIPFKCI